MSQEDATQQDSPLFQEKVANALLQCESSQSPSPQQPILLPSSSQSTYQADSSPLTGSVQVPHTIERKLSSVENSKSPCKFQRIQSPTPLKRRRISAHVLSDHIANNLYWAPCPNDHEYLAPAMLINDQTVEFLHLPNQARHSKRIYNFFLEPGDIVYLDIEKENPELYSVLHISQDRTSIALVSNKSRTSRVMVKINQIFRSSYDIKFKEQLVNLDSSHEPFNIFEKTYFVVSFSKEGQKAEICSMIKSIGGTVAPSEDMAFLFHVRSSEKRILASTSENSSLNEDLKKFNRLFLVTDRASRSNSFLQAISLGLPCVSSRYVYDCFNTQQARDWNLYLLPAGTIRDHNKGQWQKSMSVRPFHSYESLYERLSMHKGLLNKQIILLVTKHMSKEEILETAFLLHCSGSSRVHLLSDLDANSSIKNCHFILFKSAEQILRFEKDAKPNHNSPILCTLELIKSCIIFGYIDENDIYCRIRSPS